LIESLSRGKNADLLPTFMLALNGCDESKLRMGS
jgi:hypothetical protein